MTKHTFILLAVLFCIINSSRSQSLDFTGPVGTSLAFTKVFDDSGWASLNNVASLASYNSIAVGAAYQMRFNMAELSARAATVVLPTGFGTFSGLVTQSGYSKSSYSRYALSYSRLFGSSVKAGLQFTYLSHQIESADRADAFYSSLGVCFAVSKHIDLGVYIQNPEQSKISYYDDDYPLPSYFNAAVKYEIASRFMAVVELEKALELAMIYKTAIQFSFKDKLFVRGGVKGQPVELTFGGGFYIAGLTIDVGFAHHQQLGLTSGAGVSYAFNRK